MVKMVGHENSLQAASDFPVFNFCMRLVAELARRSSSEPCSAVPPLRPNLTNSNVRNSKRIVNGLVRFSFHKTYMRATHFELRACFSDFLFTKCKLTHHLFDHSDSNSSGMIRPTSSMFAKNATKPKSTVSPSSAVFARPKRKYPN